MPPPAGGGEAPESLPPGEPLLVSLLPGDADAGAVAATVTVSVATLPASLRIVATKLYVPAVGNTAVAPLLSEVTGVIDTAGPAVCDHWIVAPLTLKPGAPFA